MDDKQYIYVPSHVALQITTPEIYPTDEGKPAQNHGLGTYLTTDRTKYICSKP